MRTGTGNHCRFSAFLQREAVHADALYILGDLFEARIGDDDPEPLHAEIAAALKALQQAGVPLLLHPRQPRFSARQALRPRQRTQLLPEEKVLELYGRRILILHGDTLCTDDQAYQQFRRKVHNPLIQNCSWRCCCAGD